MARVPSPTESCAPNRKGRLWGCSGWDVRMERLTSRGHLLAGGIAFTLVSFHLQQYRTENPVVCWWLELWNPEVRPCIYG